MSPTFSLQAEPRPLAKFAAVSILPLAAVSVGIVLEVGRFADLSSWVAYLCMLRCPVVLLQTIQRGRRNGPELVMDENGLWWHYWSADVLPWKAFERAQVKSLNGEPTLALWLHDPASHKRKWAVTLFSNLNRSLGWGDLYLNTLASNASFEEMLATVQHYRPDLNLRRAEKRGS
jgi:hypothetical protein